MKTWVDGKIMKMLPFYDLLFSRTLWMNLEFLSEILMSCKKWFQESLVEKLRMSWMKILML